MLTFLIAEAVASPAGVDMPGLGPYPILQLFGGIIMFLVVGVGALIWRRGETVKQPAPGAAPMQVYMDGPLSEVLASLKKIGAALERLPEIVGDMASFKIEVAEQLRETRHIVQGRQQELVVSFERDNENLEKRVRDLEISLATIKAQQPARR